MTFATKFTKHFVDLSARGTILRRKQIVIEAPASWDASRLASLNGEELARLADEYGCDAYWETEDAEDWEDSSTSDVSGPVPDRLSADIVFVENKCGDLIYGDTGEPAPFVL